jgi:DNA transposition AAA+ family ATPase
MSTPATTTATTAVTSVPAELRNINSGLNYSVTSDNFERVIEKIPEDQAEILRWWYFHGKEQQLSLTRLATLAGVSSSALSLVFRGAYGAKLDQLCATLRKARETIKDQVGNPDFIMSALAKRLFVVFDRARALQTVAICWGAMGIGKTAICEEYRDRNNHGRTIYFRCGAGMAFGQFVHSLARALNVTTRHTNNHEIREKIFRILSAGQRLLIIDELHQIFLTTRGDSAIKIAEFLRECFDRSKCGLVLVGTEVLKQEVFNGAHKDALRQLVDRGTLQVALPAKPTRQDIAAFLSHYGLSEPGPQEDDARRILQDIIAHAGLRKLTLHLRDGAAAASKAGEPYAWQHFVRAYHSIASLSK